MHVSDELKQTPIHWHFPNMTERWDLFRVNITGLPLAGRNMGKWSTHRFDRYVLPEYTSGFKYFKMSILVSVRVSVSVL